MQCIIIIFSCCYHSNQLNFTNKLTQPSVTIIINLISLLLSATLSHHLPPPLPQLFKPKLKPQHFPTNSTTHTPLTTPYTTTSWLQSLKVSKEREGRRGKKLLL